MDWVLAAGAGPLAPLPTHGDGDGLSTAQGERLEVRVRVVDHLDRDAVAADEPHHLKARAEAAEAKMRLKATTNEGQGTNANVYRPRINRGRKPSLHALRRASAQEAHTRGSLAPGGTWGPPREREGSSPQLRPVPSQCAR